MPFGSVNEIVEELELNECSTPARFVTLRYHVVPAGSPDSVKVTGKVTGTNVIVLTIPALFRSSVPVEAVGAKVSLDTGTL